METIQQIEESNGTWLFLVPVQRLKIGKAVDFEFKVNKVTFIDSNKLAARRKRLGFPYTISSIKKKYRGRVDHLFNEHKTFATLRLTGIGKNLEKKFLSSVRDDLDILSLSQLCYNRRKSNSRPSVFYNEGPEQITSLMINLSKDESYNQNQTLGKLRTLNLDSRWKKFCKQVFFYDLINIISGKTKVSPKLRNDIRNASILAGQSQTSIDIPQCFILNMIAIETLLTKRDDKYSEKLPERVEAFIGWTKEWERSDIPNRIQQVYRKRCEFVHTGKRESITIEDILFTDDILMNVLRNIVKHPNLLGSKNKIIEFSNKVQAEHLLGVKPKVRPKTLGFLNIKYDERDFEKL